MSEEPAVEAALRWARDRYGADSVEIVDRTALEDGVSGATVERIALRTTAAGSPPAPPVLAVVVKHTSRGEVEVLTLLAELGEPAIPTLLVSQTDGDVAWMVMPWFPGESIGLMAEVPTPVAAVLARVHHRFLGRVHEWPTTLERVDSAFVRRALTEFVPASLATSAAGTDSAFRRRTASLATRLVDDQDFVNAATRFPATLLHGDVYGLNILGDASGAFVSIDWNTARVGPGMFDIAMSISTPASRSLRAYEVEWRRIGGVQRDFVTEFDWCLALINTTFAATVAQRGSSHDATVMLDAAETAYDRWRR